MDEEKMNASNGNMETEKMENENKSYYDTRVRKGSIADKVCKVLFYVTEDDRTTEEGWNKTMNKTMKKAKEFIIAIVALIVIGSFLNGNISFGGRRYVGAHPRKL